jgi:hypothetical protein
MTIGQIFTHLDLNDDHHNDGLIIKACRLWVAGICLLMTHNTRNELPLPQPGCPSCKKLSTTLVIFSNPTEKVSLRLFLLKPDSSNSRKFFIST